jgi:phosphatidylglycerol:prolipoprotein diacylglycerol transferase
MLPVLFTLPLPWGPQPVYAYGVLLGLSLIVGFQVAEHFGTRRAGLPSTVVGSAYIAATVCGLIGARALYVLENAESLQESGASVFDVTSGGVSAYGGFAGGLIGAALYLAWRRASLTTFADAAAPALALGTALTRIGCYLYGCDFGTRLGPDAPAFLKSLGTFPHWDRAAIGLYGSPAFLHHVDRYALPSDAPSSFPVHPTQLYEALAGVALLALALVLWRARRYSGQVILPVALGYAAFRFAVEYVRDDPERAELAGFSSAQLFSLVLFAGAAIAWSVARSRARHARSKDW